MATSEAVEAAKARREGRVIRDRERDEWFIDHVANVANISMEHRVNLAMKYLENKIVKNISVPVTKTVVNGRTIVTERSKPGEYPRADTTLLMKSIFSDVKRMKEGNRVDGFVGTPIDYGVILELKMNRSFMRRTFMIERSKLIRIIQGPPPA